jgi:putative phosphotransacetylase
MNQQAIQTIAEEVVQQLLKKDSKTSKIPMAVSARHCHLSQSDLEVLFGKGYELTKKADLTQTGQFAANETVMIAGPRGWIEKVRILGPARTLTQVEVSKTDSVKLGLMPPIRASGNIKDSASITLVGPLGSIYKKEGLIIAQAHIHMNPENAQEFGVENGEFVQIKVDGERPVSFEKVLIRISPKYKLEMHMDTDEANASLITSGQIGSIAKYEGMIGVQIEYFDKSTEKSTRPVQFQSQEAVVFQHKLLSQREVQTWKDSTITIFKRTIVTPLARDTARELGKTIQVIDE